MSPFSSKVEEELYALRLLSKATNASIKRVPEFKTPILSVQYRGVGSPPY